MPDTDKILQTLDRLEAGQKALQSSVEQQGKGLETLQTDVKGLSGRMDDLDLKIEAFHTEQKQANEEIIRIFHNIEEINQKEIEKRVERIERHLNLPPVFHTF